MLNYLFCSFLSEDEEDVLALGGVSMTAAAWAAPITSTSALPSASSKHGDTLYLIDEDEGEHVKKRRKLELQILEAQLEAQKSMHFAMQMFGEMCKSRIKK